ncbi:MAG: hypothetical protein WBG50_07105 [Desulfomonilaceae bacterium]
MQDLIRKLSFLSNGRLLLAIVFVIAGSFVAWKGLSELRDLWRQLSPLFPLAMPKDVSQKVAHSLPLIFQYFVVLVSSICAVLIGGVWAVSGVGNLFQARSRIHEPGNFDKPELVAESIRAGRTLHWLSTPWLVKILSAIWRPARFVSPISYQFLKQILRSFLNILLLAVVVVTVFSLLRVTPALLQKYAHININIVVPSASPLFFLLGLVAFINCLILVNLVPYRRPEIVRSCEIAPVSGRGDPHVFFALLEEGCKLLTSKGKIDGSGAIRLEGATEPGTKGTLIENFPESAGAAVSPAGYVCLPLIGLLLTMGFTRLIHFQPPGGPSGPTTYADFLAGHFPNYLVEIVFSLGLILSGLYFAEWARKLFGVHRYRSALIFCHTEEQSAPEKRDGSKNPQSGPGRASEGMRWRAAQTVDDQFAAWAKNPRTAKKFHVEVCWSEAISEAIEVDGPRHLIEARKRVSLDGALSRIIELPFYVDFQIETVACTPTPTSGACAEDGRNHADTSVADE